MLMKKVVSLGLLSTLVVGKAFAVPAIDSPFGMKIGSDGKETGEFQFDPKVLSQTVFTGSAVDGDAGTIYVPFSKLEIVKDEKGVPKFAFAYGPKGAAFTATLKASTDISATKAAINAVKKAMLDNGIPSSEIKLATLPVHRGTYRSTLAMKDGSAEWVIATTEVSNAIPTNEVAVSAALGRTAADLVVASLRSPYTILAWNYTYDFPGRASPYKAEITLHWESIFSYVKQQFGFRTVVTSVDVEKVVRRLKEDQKIDIKIVSGDTGADENKAIMDVVRIVLARTFKAHHPEPSARALDIPKPNNSGFSSMALGYAGNAGLSGVPASGWMTSVSAGYSLQDMSSKEQIDERITLVSYPYKEYTATAGVQIPGGCDDYGTHFSYVSPIADAHGNFPAMQGCPSVIYGPEKTPAPSQQAGQQGNAASLGGASLAQPTAGGKLKDEPAQSVQDMLDQLQ